MAENTRCGDFAFGALYGDQHFLRPVRYVKCKYNALTRYSLVNKDA